MIFNIPWWANLYIILLLMTVYLEVVAWEEIGDDITTIDKPSDVLILIARFIFYISVFMVTVLFFQNLESEFMKWLYLILSAYLTPFALWFIFEEIKSFIKEPAGGKDENGEETGVLLNAIGHILAVSLFGFGLAFAINGSLPIIDTIPIKF